MDFSELLVRKSEKIRLKEIARAESAPPAGSWFSIMSGAWGVGRGVRNLVPCSPGGLVQTLEMKVTHTSKQCDLIGELLAACLCTLH